MSHQSALEGDKNFNQMALRSLLRRMSLKPAMDRISRPAPRYFSDGKGRVLSEEERAAENVYIQVPSPSLSMFLFFRFSTLIPSTIVILFCFLLDYSISSILFYVFFFFFAYLIDRWSMLGDYDPCMKKMERERMEKLRLKAEKERAAAEKVKSEKVPNR